MTISGKEKYAIGLVAGLILLAISIAMFSVHDIDYRLPGVVQFFGLYIALLSFFRYLMYGKSVEVDERIRRIHAFSAYYAHLLSMVGIIILIEMDYLGYLQITVRQLLYMVGLMLAVPFVLFYAYFKLKGDV